MGFYKIFYLVEETNHLSCCNAFAEFNWDVFRPVAVQITQFDFKCGELALEKESTYKYLGLWFHEHLDMKFAVNELTK